MDWINNSETRPGFTLYDADDPDNAGHHYVIQRKNDGGVWRLAKRDNDTQPLRTIYVGTSLEDCKDYADYYRVSSDQ